MSKLLRANFTRLWKSKVFWGCILFMFGFSLDFIASQYKYMEYGYEPNIDAVLFSDCMYIPIVAAVFIGLFIGTDYSDGRLGIN